MARFRATLAARLAAWYTCSASALLFAVTGVLYFALVRSLEREDDAFLTSRARILSSLLVESPSDLAELRREVEREGGPHSEPATWVRVIVPNGAVVTETPGMPELLPRELFPAPRARPLPVPATARDRRAVRLVAVTVADPPRILQVALDCEQDAALLRSYRRRLWSLLAVGVAATVLLGYAIARRGLRPVASIAATARRTRSTALSERIATAGLPAEIADLAATFNEMLDRLQDAFDRLSRFSADLAHELRTPVQNLRGEIEVALRRERSAPDYREVLGSALEELDRLSRLIEQLLFLARAEDPRAEIRRERVGLRALLESSAEFFAPAAEEAGVALEVSCAIELEAAADRALLQRALANLLANALAHTPRGGRIHLSATTAADRLLLEVSDNGGGIAGEQLPRIGERFFRGDPSRALDSGGAGLGLAIVQGIARLHGGAMEIDSELGRGTRVRLLLPASVST